MNLKALRKNIRYFLIVCLLFVSLGLYAQLEPLSTQYMQSQLLINPAYAGTHNSLAVFTSARHQWVGIDGAPKLYQINVHAPLNSSKVALGGSLQQYSAGPSQIDEFNAVYGYVLRINNGLLFSFGLNGGLNYFSVSGSDLVLVDQSDPMASFDQIHKIKPVVGVGGFLYSPDYYVGVSIPQVLNVKYQDKETSSVYALINRHYYLTAGYTLDITKKIFLKSSFLFRYSEGGTNLLDLNLMGAFHEKFWVGASYRFNEQLAMLAGVRLNKTMSFTYSYDMGFSSDNGGINKNAHEVSISFDFYSMIKRNKYRIFKRKIKKETEDEDSMRSIRFF